MAIPRNDAALVPWSTNFNQRIVADYAVFHVTQPQATAYTPLHAAYVSAVNDLNALRADGTNSKSMTSTRTVARDALLDYARQLYKMIQADALVSDADKILIGIHVPKTTPTPVPAPVDRPGTDLGAVVGRMVSLHIHDSASSTKRGKPKGAVSAWVYAYVGTTYPSDPTLWQFMGAYNKGEAEIVFADSVAAGAQVWVCAAWVNLKGEAGPVSVPVTTNLQGGTANPATMKIAA